MTAAGRRAAWFRDPIIDGDNRWTREHGAKAMAGICLNHLIERYGPVLAVGDVIVPPQGGRITGFRGPNGAGTTATLRMPVELTGPTPGTPTVDRHTRLQPAQLFPAMGAMTDSAVSHPPRAGRDTPRGRDKSSPAIRRPVTRLGLAATAVLIFVVAVAAVYLAAHGWSHTVQQLVHAARHLPRPLRALVGGSAGVHLLN